MSDALRPLIAKFNESKVIFSHDGTEYTHEAFANSVLRLSKELGKCQYLINLCGDRFHVALGFCAALLDAGVNVLPSNTQRDAIFSIVRRYPSARILIDADQFSDLPNVLDIRTIDLSSQGSAREGELLIDMNRLAAIAFTSGSTGEPKANEKTWGILSSTARLLGKRFDSEKRIPRVLATVPSQHMYGLEMTIMMALQAGWCLHCDHPFYPQDIAEALEGMPSPRVLVTTPVHLRVLLKSKVQIPALHLIVSATAPLSKELASQAESKFCAPVKEIYGCTEAGSLATRQTSEAKPWEALDGIILTQKQNNFWVAASHLPMHVQLSDVLNLESESRFDLLGRSADMLNVAGKRASIADLTKKLQGIDGVEDAIMFLPPRGKGKHEEKSQIENGGHSGGHKEQRPAALVVSTKLSEHQVIDAFAREVDPVFLPRPLRIVSKIPRNSTGKAPIKCLLELIS